MGKISRIHFEKRRWVNSSNGLYCFRNINEIYESKNYLFRDSFYLYISSETQDNFLRKELIKNSFTKKMTILKVNKLGNYGVKLEIVQSGQRREDELWRHIVFEQHSAFEEEIREGQEVKIGRSILKVSKINNTRQKTERISLSDQQSVKSEKQSINHCRICLNGEDNNNEYVQDICQCSSHNPIHFKCLLKWIQNKFKQDNSHNKEVKFLKKNLIQCELCKDDYPEFIQWKGKRVCLLQIPESDQPFIEFEVYKQTGVFMGKYMIFPEKNQGIYTLGRNDRNDLVLKENSISRQHCFIKYNQGRWFIRDLNSKFGTFVKIQQNCILSKKCPERGFVVDKTHFQFHPTTLKKCHCKKILLEMQWDVYSQDHRFEISPEIDITPKINQSEILGKSQKSIKFQRPLQNPILQSLKSSQRNFSSRFSELEKILKEKQSDKSLQFTLNSCSQKYFSKQNSVNYNFT